MAKPRRRGKPAPRKRTRRLGTMLLLVGVLSVLGGTFIAGALAGRLSLRPSTSVADAKAVDRPAKPAPTPQPEITFYRALTAPLTPLPPPPKPAKAAARRETGASPPERAGGGRYTVQVGSYNMRAQAEALRARLAVAGHQAYIAEGEAAGVTRYRVRIGAFATAEDAREAAVRLASQAHVATYVTTR